jgi:hypothetical protein
MERRREDKKKETVALWHCYIVVCLLGQFSFRYAAAGIGGVRKRGEMH